MLKVDFTKNRRYMQNASFWQDPHNSQMFDLGQCLFSQRRLLTSIAQNAPKDFFQRTDGLIEHKKPTGLFSFLKGASYYKKLFVKDMNSEYKCLKQEISDLANNAKSSMIQSSKKRNI